MGRIYSLPLRSAWSMSPGLTAAPPGPSPLSRMRSQQPRRVPALIPPGEPFPLATQSHPHFPVNSTEEPALTTPLPSPQYRSRRPVTGRPDAEPESWPSTFAF
ncbi:hypothetical protein AAFF_G00093260 [Aldrovandia affinis]|uniref:Uncharacterized protein n=1 Tax=Aldrovandia affinis TaxID=143900 RepID=A0AAD7T2R0_9TELE|nr:hypothetical protein AAFF_G00093260 [Aldrovandia affinis]